MAIHTEHQINIHSANNRGTTISKEIESNPKETVDTVAKQKIDERQQNEKAPSLSGKNVIDITPPSSFESFISGLLELLGSFFAAFFTPVPSLANGFSVGDEEAVDNNLPITQAIIDPPNDPSIDDSGSSKEGKESLSFFDEIQKAASLQSEASSNIISSKSQQKRNYNSLFFEDFSVVQHQAREHWTLQQDWRERAYFDRIERPRIASLIAAAIK